MAGRALTAEYSRFLYGLGKSDIENVCDFFVKLSRALHETKNFVRFVYHPSIPMVEKIETMQQLFGVIPAGVQSVLREILLKRKTALIPQITERLLEIRDRENGVVAVTVTSPVELSDSQKTKLSEKLSGTFSRIIAARFAIDPSLMAGLRVQVGNTIFDNSVKNCLKSIKEVLNSQSRG